jgi:hypothetical protein
MDKNPSDDKRFSPKEFPEGLQSVYAIVNERSRFRERIFNLIKWTCFASQTFGIAFILSAPFFKWTSPEVIGFVALISIPDIIGLLAGKLFNYDVDERLVQPNLRRNGQHESLE